MKLVGILTAILLLAPQIIAQQLETADVSGKWYRMVPGSSLFLDFSADGTCKVERGYYDGREHHSILATAKWHFDGWCVVVEPEKSTQVEKALDGSIRLSMIEIGGGERVLGFLLHWDAREEMLSADVFRRGEHPKFNPPSAPDAPSESSNGKKSPNKAVDRTP